MVRTTIRGRGCGQIRRNNCPKGPVTFGFEGLDDIPSHTNALIRPNSPINGVGSSLNSHTTMPIPTIMGISTILDEAWANKGANTAPPKKIVVKKTQTRPRVERSNQDSEDSEWP
ncbi:hypothetical protein PVK06_026996 [Gossypium arboreum]|uniref:Uncharacterized protein n=1 Tax=Gossypium arboreum TaxID=29729 RepID=A0ABR0NZ78_GOSAR|nr:hypothetical protein PVK06_026996 [Gossypium arboreum]